MNRIFISLLIVLSILTSCEDSLDRNLRTTLYEDEVAESYDFMTYMINAIYAELPSGFMPIDGAMMASATDEAEHTLETSDIQVFNTGSWDAFYNPDDVWYKYFKAIRKVNNFLHLVDSINLDQLAFDPNPAQQVAYKLTLQEIKEWKYEARGLRAFFYLELVKRYGGVPIITEILPVDADFSKIKRNTLEECIQFITDECDSAASVLPDTYGSTELSRFSSIAAHAIKSRTLLYAASDLFNTNNWAQGYGTPELISLSGKSREERWKIAADAAKEAIDAASSYRLNNDFSDVFRTFRTREVILVKRMASANAFEKASLPVGYDLGKGGTTPTQNLVDAFEVLDTTGTIATNFDWDNPEHAANPYENRDPRLYYSILTNGTMFKGRPVESYIGGSDGKPKPLATRTGYYIKKYIDEELDLVTDKVSVHFWILFRIAELYLNYAEALNEYDPGNPDILFYLNEVRTRRSVEMPEIPEGLNQEKMREKIRHELQVEFAFEDHRAWDIRRWMTAPEVLESPIKGVEITALSDSTYEYEVVTVENRVFEPKMYFYPIPYNEVLIGGWTQNPFWN